jgi:hypothetical protein
MQSFVPLYRRGGFWVMQLLPLSALAAAMYLRYGKAKANGGQQAEWRRQRAGHLANLRAEGNRNEFFENAARALQFDTALATGRNPEALGAADICALRKMDSESAAVVQEVFHVRAEALYAGGGGGGEVSSVDRRRILIAIEQMGGSK